MASFRATFWKIGLFFIGTSGHIDYNNICGPWRLKMHHYKNYKSHKFVRFHIFVKWHNNHCSWQVNQEKLFGPWKLSLIVGFKRWFDRMKISKIFSPPYFVSSNRCYILFLHNQRWTKSKFYETLARLEPVFLQLNYFSNFFKNVGHSRPLFIYFCLCNTVDSKQVNTCSI